MDSVRPEATSTPATNTRLRLRSRKAISEHHSMQSPIQPPIFGKNLSARSYENVNNYRSTHERSQSHSPNQSRKRSQYSVSPPESDDEEDLDEDIDDDDQSVDEIESREKENEWDKNLIYFICVASLVIAIVCYFISKTDSSSATFNLTESFTKFEKLYPKQNEDFWLNIRVSIQEIPVLKQPRTIIFLYEPKSERTMNRILQEVIEAGLCEISSCSQDSVLLRGESLSELKHDYGRIISENRERLEQSGVMVVKNLEKVPGVAAQAFHSICDDYNPVVKKALILFTLKVNEIPKKFLTSFAEKTLLNLWMDIGKDDKFYPLFTRISSTVLAVQPE